MKQIDFKVNTQIFAAKGEPEVKNGLKIVKGDLVGKGAQAEVFKVTVKGMEGKMFVDKTKNVKNNRMYADRELRNMFSEFSIAKDLDHPNIIKYKYFMRNFEPHTKSWDFHIIIEYMEGQDMNHYIKKNEPKVNVIQNIGK